ncbi:MAG TPA: methionyl-tRNA formyltransferase [Vicinamibacterales bacterium]|jgi:methionyl-tRNA formyltransferase
MSALRTLFFGTPGFAVPSLRALATAGFPVVGVVTQPDRPRGRGQKPSPGPVKSFALANGLTVLQPERLKDEPFLETLRALAPDLGIVAAYGKILPVAVLDLPRLGLVNVHASLLPRWRGASPVHRAVMSGDDETGVSIMRVVQALDAGAVFDRARRPIGPNETSEAVEHDLAELGARLLMTVIARIERREAVETPQDEAGVTYAPRLTREDGVISWNAPAAAIHNQVRGLYPWPHAVTVLHGERVIVLETSTEGAQETVTSETTPGDVLAIRHDGIVVATGDRPLRLLRLQAEGRRPVTAREFAAGARLVPGTRFGR